MAEDSWLRCEREYFAQTEASVLDIPEKKLSKALEKYNKFLQAALFGESPFVAEDLRLTIIKSGGEIDRK
jgi:hypothetical protein